METAANTTTDQSLLQSNGDNHAENPFSQQQVTITKAEHIDLIHRANYWEALHAQLKKKCARLEEENQRKDARIRDINNRVFGKKSEKQATATSEESESSSGQRGENAPSAHRTVRTGPYTAPHASDIQR